MRYILNDSDIKNRKLDGTDLLKNIKLYHVWRDIAKQGWILETVEEVDKTIWIPMYDSYIKENPPVMCDVAEREANKYVIYGLFKRGGTYYYSDIVKLTNIPLEEVEEICNELKAEGKIFTDLSFQMI